MATKSSRKQTKKTLGRGLGNLLDSSSRLSESASNKEANKGIVDIEMGKIRISENNPRKKFNESSIKELSETIKEFGLLQPILVRSEDEYYIVISGERRLRALRLLKQEKVPCLIKKVSKQQNLEISLIENIQREQLDAIEEAVVYKELIEQYKLTQEEVSLRVGKNRSTIANRVRLLNLPATIQALVANGQLTEGQVRPLVSIKSAALQEKLGREILSKGMNSRQIEDLVRSQQGKPNRSSSKKVIKVDSNIRAQEEILEELFSTRVKISHNPATNAGKISIEYFNLADFERLKKKLKKK